MVNLLSFQKPSRYINSEKNSVHRQAPLSVVLAFPDIYDVGMSHLGLKILYAIINAMPFASAERAFSPWLDLEEAMKAEGVLLKSLESERPLKDFDVVGFSLQYELSYPTILNMLHLGGIPVTSEERRMRTGFPVIIAGGPCTVNPMPMSAFIDAFLVGDAEDAIHEIMAACHAWKLSGETNKDSLFRALSDIEGVWVPSAGRDRRVKRRFIESLEDAPFPDAPVVPFTNIVHDRVNIEIARGCSAGCRFCQAGMIYRPVRERSPETVVRLSERSLCNTGHDSLSFTSLSAGDHSCLLQIMRESNRRFSGQRISISLPSLRVGSVNPQMLKELRTVRKTGFTIAPEAGTDRLRAVINKDFTAEMYLQALETLFREGWQSLKLYFMTGLPTETEEDIDAISDMVHQAIRISKKLTGRHVSLSVGVSSFVPKPHTPFQWFGQNDIETLRGKNRHLRKMLLRRGVQFRGHDVEMSMLEAAIARGDEKVGALIRKAWELGCRLDAWTEAFDFGRWQQAMDLTGIDAEGYASRFYEQKEPLPWEVVDTGVSREYLRGEYDNAMAGRFTEDCRRQCQGCGLECSMQEEGRERLQEAPVLLRPDRDRGIPPSMKVRLRYAKTGRARYLSHLELGTALVRAMRRAGFPFQYSGGFHPAPKLSFGPALGVGTAGTKEYLDIELLLPFDPEKGLSLLNSTLPEGISADGIMVLTGREKSLNSFIVRYTYEVRHGDPEKALAFLEREDVMIQRKQNSVNIRAMVEEIVSSGPETVSITLRDLGEVKVRLDEIIPEVFGVPSGDVLITRTAMYGWDGQWREPFEEIPAWAAKS